MGEQIKPDNNHIRLLFFIYIFYRQGKKTGQLCAMDPLTALSLAGTVVQFVDFSGKLISSSRQLYTKDELDVHAQAALATNDILDYTVKLRQKLIVPDGTTTLSEDDLVLENICKECDNLAHDLLGRLDKLKVPKKGKKAMWVTIGVALQSIWTKEELSGIQARLKDYRNQIDSRVIQSLR